MVDTLPRGASPVGAQPELPFKPYIVGKFEPGKISVQTQPRQELSPQFRNYLVKNWREAGRPWSGLRRTWTFPKSPITRDGRLLLTVAPGYFREFTATRDSEVRQIFPEEMHRVDPVAVTLVTITGDDLLVVGTRGRSELSVIGGNPEVPDDVTRFGRPKDIDESGRWAVHRTALRESYEEAGIKPDEQEGVHANGIVFVGHTEVNRSLVTFTSQTAISAAEISHRPNCGEIDVAFLPYSKDAIENLFIHFYSLLRTSKATLLLFGKNAFGDKWYDTWNAQLTSLWQYYMKLNEAERNKVKERDINYLHNELLVNI